MTSPTLLVNAGDVTYDLMAPRSVRELLVQALPGLVEVGGADHVRVDRCWPIGSPQPSGYAMEWSFTARERRYCVYGELDGRRKPNSAVCARQGKSARPRLTADGLRGLDFRVDGSSLTLRSPDQDALLPQMAVCLNSRAMSDRLAAFGMRAGGTGTVPSRFKCRLGGYRPGRRATMRYGCGLASGQGLHLCGKTFRDGRGRPLVQQHLRISEELRRVCGGRIRVPSPVGFDEELRLALFVWMPGRRGESLATAQESVLDAAAEALSVLHELPSHGRPEFCATDEQMIVDRWRRVTEQLLPDAAPGAQELAGLLADASKRVRRMEIATIHRDFYEKQIILSSNCITVLDLDTLACGDAAVDLGNFVAHLLLRALASGRPHQEHRAQAERFLCGYEQRRGKTDPFQLSYYTASSLFRLGAVHSLRTATSRFRDLLWDAAKRQLEIGTNTARAPRDAKPQCRVILGRTE